MLNLSYVLLQLFLATNMHLIRFDGSALDALNKTRSKKKQEQLFCHYKRGGQDLLAIESRWTLLAFGPFLIDSE